MMNRKRTEVKDVAEYTPMMQQYLKTKEEYKDCILFYRLGDFYEMFFDDAIVVSKELELTLTGKSCGAEERAPMCGVPYHAVEGYLNKLVANGHKVAICEQVEDPKLAKGLVKREVRRRGRRWRKHRANVHLHSLPRIPRSPMPPAGGRFCGSAAGKEAICPEEHT